MHYLQIIHAKQPLYIVTTAHH